jgi:Zn-dependent protease/predicted transcriptional regulator
MNRGLRIGRIFGINIYLDASWLVIFFLVTWSLAAGLLPAWHPDWSLGLRWVVAVLAALLFFASILLHELSHSLVAKAHGLEVRRITLFLFGGAANIEREPHTPKVEFLMAVVGPITSILLGVIFLSLSTFSLGAQDALADPIRALEDLGPVTTLLAWLGPVNIFLGVFNLLPGFPLDGGRILRAALWQGTGDLAKATRWAAGVGRLTGFGFMLIGIAMIFGVRVPIFGTGVLSGLWLVMIGWFLSDAARSSYQQTLIRDLLEDVPVFRLMRPNVPVVPPTLTVEQLVYEWIMGTDERAFPVMDGDRLLGMVCLEDIRKVPRQDWDRVTVAEIMTQSSQLDVVDTREDASQALERLTRHDVRQVPVLENGRLVGLLRRRDILKWLQVQSGLGLPEARL